MAYIELENISLEYPIYNAESSSLKHHLMNITTGGLIAKNAKKNMVIKAISDINLKISNGDKVGIIGHNGSGKTTLLRCISGIYKPTSGKIIRNGSLVPIIEIGAGIELELSGYRNIKRLLNLRGIDKSNIQENIKNVIEFSELGNYLSFPVRTYSSGMMMRLMFSVATVCTPDILVLDEFFSVGDESFREKAEARIMNKINDSSILIFATHSNELVNRYCNISISLKNGKIINES